MILIGRSHGVALSEGEWISQSTERGGSNKSPAPGYSRYTTKYGPASKPARASLRSKEQHSS